MYDNNYNDKNMGSQESGERQSQGAGAGQSNVQNQNMTRSQSPVQNQAGYTQAGQGQTSQDQGGGSQVSEPIRIWQQQLFR